MKRLCISLNGGDYINVEADLVELRDNAIIAMKGEELAAYADLSVVLSARVNPWNGQGAEVDVHGR